MKRRAVLLAGSLLWLGGRRELGELRNGRWSTTAVALSLMLCVALAARQAFDLVAGSP